MSLSRTPLSFVLAAALGCAVTVAGAPQAGAAADPVPQMVTFAYTGSTQTWTVPADVVKATLDLYGAQGAGEGNGGLGGRATATIAVTPGDVITIVVGGTGGHPAFEGPTAIGYNGGGDGWHAGGGATDVRVGGTDLDDRVLVAGGGGGSTSFCAADRGGDGGESGLPGSPATTCTGTPGGGATSTAGGENTVDATLNGTAGQGGGRPGDFGNGVSGGGGGWFGGAGALDAAGGGGSSHGPAGTVFETGVRTAHGVATVTFAPSAHLDVTRTGSGTGTVTSAPAGIDCGNTCAAWFDLGSDVSLTATPDTASTFSGWSGACTGTGMCVVTMDQARDVTAMFAQIPAPVPTPAATPTSTLPPTPTVTPGADPKPVLSDLRVKPGRITAGGRAKATLHYAASEDVQLSVRLRRICHGEVCGRYFQVPATAEAGAGTYRLRGVLKPTQLRPGRYRLTLVAKDDLGQRDKKRVFFWVRR